jgi:hypothetical protein
MKKAKDSFLPGKAWNQSKINDCWFKEQEPYKKAIRGLIGHPLYAETLLHFKNKSVVYSFNKINNIYPLLNKTEYLLKSLFLSTYSLISRPVYLIKHDKIIIRLFVFLSPKVEKYLDTSLIGQGGKLQGASPSIFYRKRLVAGKQFLIKFLKFKSFRPKTVNILKSQIKLNSSASVAAPTVTAAATNTAAVNYSKADFTCTSKYFLLKNLERIVKIYISPEPILRSGTLNASLSLQPAMPSSTSLAISSQRAGEKIASEKTRGTGDLLASPVKQELKTDLPLAGWSKGKEALPEGVLKYTFLNSSLAQAKPAAKGSPLPLVSRNTYPYISFVSHFKKNLDRLSIIFSQIFKKRVEFDIIKAQLPFQDSNLLAQILGYNANNYQFRKMLKILTPRAVIKNPSKELGSASLSQHKQMFGIGSSATELGLTEELGLRAKDINILFSQPNSYLPPFFYSKFYLKWINRFLFSSYRPAKQLAPILSPLAAAAAAAAAGRGRFISQPSGQKQSLPLSLTAVPQVKGADSATLIKATEAEKTKNNMLRGSSYLSGMNIKLAGRLMTQSMRPRFTVQSKQEGSLARVKVHYIEKSRFTGKNKRGAFSFTVTIGHVLN